MPRSMTGFGAAQGPLAGGRLSLEIRSVNHRHFNLQLRVPAELQALEPDLRDRLRQQLERGQITVAARWIEEPARPSALRLDLARARELVQAARQLGEALGLPGELELSWLLRQPDVLVSDPAPETAIPSAELLDLLDQAMRQLVAMRESEGAALTRQLLGCLAALEEELARIEARAPERLVAERDRLRRAVAALADGHQLDEARLAQEIALLAERWDIAEEIARLKAHLAACRTALAAPGPVGRQLAFLAQELLREVNTIGSKANDAAIAQSVIAMKGVIEQFREQVDNLE